MKNVKSAPLDGLAGLKQNFKSDLLAGFIVFLIALPLSLGIAIAAGLPPMAGIIGAFVGGMVVSLISGSYVTINGPAAGLIVVVVSLVESLGHGDALAGYRYMLAACVVAGIMLVVAGLLQAGKIGDFFPLSVVHGMLAAIGVIIMSKQIHVVLGVKPTATSPLGLLAEVPHSLMKANPKIAIIGLSSLAILIAFTFVKNRYIKRIPAPLVATLTGIALGLILNISPEGFYGFAGLTFETGPQYLVDLPESFMAGFATPDFSIIQKDPITFASCVVTVFLVVGLESLLSTKAVDQIDPYKRHSNLNRDMAAVGIGTALSGALGGYPIIAEIVRSSANISNGAKTRWANFFHGLFVLLAALLIPHLLHYIPLAALAGMLTFIGYRLCSPKEFFHVYEIGREQLVVFVGTIIAVLATDLLKGVAIGLLIEFVIAFFHTKRFINPFKATVSIQAVATEQYNVVMDEINTFANFIAVKRNFEAIPAGKHVAVDFSHTCFVDHTAMENLTHLKQQYNTCGGDMHFVKMEHLKPLSHHHLAARHKKGRDLGTKKLTPRQLDLAAVAENIDYCFSFHKELPNKFLYRFEFFHNEVIKFEENFIDGMVGLGDAHLQISDVAISKKHHINSRQYAYLTVALTTHLPYKMPQFTLEEEHPIPALAFTGGYRDIDFSSHPVFSKKYLLWGKHEDKIRSLFSEKLLDFLSANPVYLIQSAKNALLVMSINRIEAEDMPQFIEFNQKLARLLSETATN